MRTRLAIAGTVVAAWVLGPGGASDALANTVVLDMRSAACPSSLGPADVLQVLGTAGNDQIRLGSTGATLVDSSGGCGPVHLTGVRSAVLVSDGGRDLISGGGGDGIGGPVAYPLTIYAGDAGGVYGGGSGSDRVIGGAGADEIYGQAGSDVLDGGAGDDVISGGEGDDRLEDGAGDDTIAGDAGWDTLAFGALYAGSRAPASGVRVDLSSVARQDTIGAGRDAVSGVEAIDGSPRADRLIGNDGANRLYGEAGDDVLSGGSGQDLLSGGLGNDVLSGDGSNDELRGDAGTDLASYASAATGVAVQLGAPGWSRGSAGTDVLWQIEGVIGSAYGDGLTGDGQANVLVGGDGDDRIDGRAGADVLSGAGGRDRLISADGAPDQVSCGADRDSYKADRVDRVASDCERRAASPRHRPTGRMRVIGLTTYVRGRMAVLRLECPSDASVRCRGTVSLQARVRVKGKLKLHRVGRARLKRIAPARTRPVRVRLSRAAVRRMRHARNVRAVITIRASDGVHRKVGARGEILLRRRAGRD